MWAFGVAEVRVSLLCCWRVMVKGSEGGKQASKHGQTQDAHEENAMQTMAGGQSHQQNRLRMHL